MAKIKKIESCLALAIVIMVVVSAATMPQSLKVFPKSLVVSGDRASCWDSCEYYAAEAGFLLDSYTSCEGTSAAFRILSHGNSSNVDRRMRKDAVIARHSEQRSIWKAYVTEYSRSITEGGKNSIISSTNLFKGWHDALRPIYYA